LRPTRCILQWTPRCTSNREPKAIVVMRKRLPVIVPAGLLAAFIGIGPAPAQTPAGAFAGKTITLAIGFSPSSVYDAWGRVVARHIGRHLPGNPTVTAQNMEGAGSYRAANYIYNAAPKDGTSFALIGRDAPLGPLIGAPAAQFDATKMSWLGTPTVDTSICVAYRTAAVKTVQDLLDHQLVIGDTGPGAGTSFYPKALKGILGLKFKLVSGYPGSGDVLLAMERGEVEGICESLDSLTTRRPDWIATRTIAVLFQAGLKPNAELTGVPMIADFAHDDADRQAITFLYAGQGIGRPFVAPPNLPPDRLAMLREAFMATMNDPEFIAEARQRKLALEPQSGDELEALIRKAYATPRPVIERVGQITK
jgi:tripartite-type tricarboxylate transporter receptor subunit TctC